MFLEPAHAELTVRRVGDEVLVQGAGHGPAELRLRPPPDAVRVPGVQPVRPRLHARGRRRPGRRAVGRQDGPDVLLRRPARPPGGRPRAAST
ncbi:MAG: hypothetical protein MZU95_12935 [Desulfomicrobium escambiense]|nr:hypothetical protein [Desulfomicrobium escambiense]